MQLDLVQLEFHRGDEAEVTGSQSCVSREGGERSFASGVAKTQWHTPQLRLCGPNVLRQQLHEVTLVLTV